MPLGQRIAHMAPEGRLGILDSLQEGIISAGNGRLEMLAEAFPRLPLAFAGGVTEDESEFAEAVTPPRELFGRDLELAHAHVLEGGERLLHVACRRPCSQVDPSEQAEACRTSPGLGEVAQDAAQLVGEPRLRVERAFSMPSARASAGARHAGCP